MIANLIGSEHRRPSEGTRTLPVFNPATGEVIDQVPMSTAADVDAAVEAAVRAYRGWSKTALMERVRLMFRFKAVLEGNTYVLKPSERTPLGGARLAELFLEAGFPDGVLNVVHGARETVEALLTHPDVRAISFVGSE